MKDKTDFCHKCNNEVNVSIECTTLHGKLKGHDYVYEGIEKSTDCGHILFDDEVDKHNKQALYDTYRIKNNIICLDKIREIPEKYDIGKRPLSNLLDWGELTFTRYFVGDIPSKAYSDILNVIYNNPEKYMEILENNKHFISSKAYDKSKLATINLIGDNSKIQEILNYISSICYDISPLFAQKLLYYCDGFYYAFFKETLFEDNCYASEHGSIYLDIYNKQKNQFLNYEKTEFNLTHNEKAIVDSVVKNLGCFSSSVLKDLTISETPWINAKGKLNYNSKETPTINKEDIHNYFERILTKYNMIFTEDIYLYSKAHFNNI